MTDTAAGHLPEQLPRAQGRHGDRGFFPVFRGFTCPVSLSLVVGWTKIWPRLKFYPVQLPFTSPPSMGLKFRKSLMFRKFMD